MKLVDKFAMVEQIINYNHMSFEDNLFSTEVKGIRPQTTHNLAHRFSLGESSAYSRMKQMKERSKSMQREYLQRKKQVDRAKKNVEEINHRSAIKRTQFLKIYANKKAKFQIRELLQNHKHQRQCSERNSLDLVNRRRLQYELQHILIQNEQQNKIYQLQKANKIYKQGFKRQLQLANQKLQASKHHQEIKKANNQFMIRKRNMQTAIVMRSKKNYFNKVNQELSLIQNYGNILNQIDSYTRVVQFDESKLQNSTECQTIDRGQTMLLTLASKNTLQ